MSFCVCGAAEDEERRQAYLARREQHRLDNPNAHRNILERLQWIYRKEIKGAGIDRPYVQVAYYAWDALVPVGDPRAPIAGPIPHTSYLFFREEHGFETHRTVRWTCQGLTIAEETEFYELR